MNANAKAGDNFGSSIIRGAALGERIFVPKFRYRVRCIGPDGKLKWEEIFENVVTTVGKNDLLDKYFAGSGYTATWYLGLIDADGYTTGPAVGHTMASHTGWAESTEYSEANRPTITFAAASGGSKSSSADVRHTMNASTTIKGAFVVNNNTKGGTTGILYSAGLFTGGDKVLQSADKLDTAVTLSIT